MFSKYAWVASLKYKRGIAIVNAIHIIISKRRKPNKIWVDQGGEFYNKLLKRFLKIKNIKIDSTYNKVNSVFAKSFIRMLKNKISNHMTVFSKNVYFDVLDDVINKYNNAVHRTINMDISWTYAISDLNGEPITGTFMKKNSKK